MRTVEAPRGVRLHFGPLLLFILLNAALPAILSRNQSSVSYAWTQFCHAKQGEDSWYPMASAFDLSQLHQSEDIYDVIFFRDHIKFQYPPTSLMFFYPLILLSRAINCDLSVILNCISWLAVLLTVAFVALLCRSLPMLDQARRPTLWNTFACYGSITIAVITFFPVVKAYGLGQIQAVLNCIVTAAILAEVRGAEQISGGLLGLACLVKPQYGVVLIWSLFRKRWRFLKGFALILFPACLLSIEIYGLKCHVHYLTVLSYLSHHGEAFYPNQSPNGFLNRLLHNGSALSFDPGSFPPYRPAVFFGTTLAAAILLLILGAMLRFPNSSSTIELCTVLLTSTMASPIAWEHQYGILIGVYCILFSCFTMSGGRISMVLLGISYVLTSNYFDDFTVIRSSPGGIAHMYRFVGVLVAYGLLYKCQLWHQTTLVSTLPTSST